MLIQCNKKERERSFLSYALCRTEEDGPSVGQSLAVLALVIFLVPNFSQFDGALGSGFAFLHKAHFWFPKTISLRAHCLPVPFLRPILFRRHLMETFNY